MKKFIVLFMMSFLVGCAGVSRWEPTMNHPVGYKFAATEEQDIAECKVLADKAAGWLAEGSEGALAGATFGASEGAILGSMAISSATIVVPIAAAISGVAGLWYSEYESNLTYKRSYSNCLYQRGHYPIN